MCSCPTSSSSVDGRSRWASGAVASRRLPAASSKRSPTRSVCCRRRGASMELNNLELVNDRVHERLGEVLEPVHAELVEKLAPQAGERFLDVGAGTGSV